MTVQAQWVLWSEWVQMKLEWLPGKFAVCRLAPDAPVPGWATRGGVFSSITRTDQELSIITNEADVGSPEKVERGFVALRVVGPIEFNIVGVLASLTAALRDAGVPVLAVSTFDTDILLIREAHAGSARAALAAVADVPVREA